MRHIKPVAVVLLALSLGWVGGLSQTSQTVTITVNQSLYLDCSASAAINYTVTQTDIEGTQPFDIGTLGLQCRFAHGFHLECEHGYNYQYGHFRG
jgi:hypothetical protein